MADFTIKQGDTAPVLTDTLTYSDGSSPNLAGGSVKFVMRSSTQTGPATSAAATITNNTNPATVSYTFTASDTANAGQFAGAWIVTFSGGSIMTWPTDGYLDIWIEENLTSLATQRLVGLSEVKTHLRLAATDRTHDARLLEMIDAARPVIEGICGPILLTNYTEYYDGGQWFIQLRHRPSAANGATMVVEVEQVVEYRGPIPYNLTQVPTPDLGTIYSYQVDTLGRLVRRTVGGGITPFPPGANQVIVTYTAGYSTVPANVREATLELVRENFQQTEMAQHSGFGTSGGMRDDEEPAGAAIGFYITPRVRELLSPHKRAPSVA